MLRIVIWYLFLDILAKVKNFVRWSHLLNLSQKRKWCLFMVISYCTCEYGRVTKFEVSYSFTDLNGFTFSPSILWKKIYLWNTGWSNLNQTIGHPKKILWARGSFWSHVQTLTITPRSYVQCLSELDLKLTLLFFFQTDIAVQKANFLKLLK